MKNQISKRKFIYCSLYNTEIPKESSGGCCEFYNEDTNKCEYKKYSSVSKKTHLSEREEIYLSFSSRDDEE